VFVETKVESAVMSSSAGDQYLIGQIRSGDAEAWRRLIDRYQGRLVQFARRRLNDPSAAEDVAQETLVGFLQALPRYDDARPLENFLFSIAHHKLIDHLRRAGRREEVEAAASESFAEWPEAHAHAAPPPSSWLLRKERDQRERRALADALRGLVQELLRKERFDELKVVELIFCRAKRNKDVARALGIDEKAVARTKARVLENMRGRARQADPNHTLFPGLWPG